MSILDALFGRQNNGQQAQVPGAMQQQPGFLSPEVAMPIAGALLGNEGNTANFGKALSMYGMQAAQTGRQNKTMAFLRKNAPDMAAMLEAGAPMEDVWGQYVQSRKAQKPNIINAGDGRLYNADDNSWITAPGGGDDYSQRQRAAEQYGLTPDDPRYQPFLLTGKFPREDAQELTATDKKAMWAAEDEIPSLDNTIESLDLAKKLNDKTYTGWTAGLRGRLGTNAPGGSMIFDEQTSKDTLEFNKLMSMEAIQAMASTLKGATTDSELARFVDILADPTTPADIRGRTIDRMKQLAERHRQVKTSRIDSIRGAQQQAPNGGAGMSTTSTGATWRLK